MKHQIVTLLSLIFEIAAIPVRKNEPWTILLCQFYGVEDIPHSRRYYEDFLTSDRSGSVQDYFRRVSNGLYTIEGSNVFGWYKIPYSETAIAHIAAVDQKLSHHGAAGRKISHKIAQLCARAAKIQKFDMHRKRITIVNAGNYAIFTAEYGILLSPTYAMTSALVHEMVHSFNIGHSFSDRQIVVYPHAKYGEYDDRFDLMSTSNAYMFNDNFGFNGPGLSGPHLDYLGWLPQNRLAYVQSPGTWNIRIASLSRRTPDENPLLVSVPYDRDNPQHVFTIEYRTRDGLDAGLSQNSVVLHKISPKSGYFYSYLLAAENEYGLSNGSTYFKYLNGDEPRPYVKIDVLDMNPDYATVAVDTTFDPERCRMNEIRRDAFHGDKVCVHARHPRKLTQKDRDLDKKWSQYKLFFDRHTFGMNACRKGYVWRSIDNFDYACVSESTKLRTQFQTERDLRSSERSCPVGYTQRQAFPGDAVCVTWTEFELTARENQRAPTRLLYHKFFNGVDEVR